MPEAFDMSEYDCDVYWHDKALAAAKADPLRVARLAVVKTARFWSPAPNSHRFSGALRIRRQASRAVLPVYLLAFLGARLRRGIHGGSPFYSAGGAAILYRASFGVRGSARYRTPVMPLWRCSRPPERQSSFRRTIPRGNRHNGR